MPFLAVDDLPLSELAEGVCARRIIDRPSGSGALTIGELVIKAGSPPRRRHRHTVEEGIIVRQGQGRFRLGDEEQDVEAGWMILVPAGTVHGMRNVGGVDLLAYFVYPAVNVAREEVDEI
jgi:mannose-6-phosphate isomerase-like protein (cupin superfamily)